MKPTTKRTSTTTNTGAKARRDGHTWERRVVKWLSSLFPTLKIGTSRYHSKYLDDAKVDVFIEPGHFISDWLIQCKKMKITTKGINIPVDVLDEMPDGPKLLFTKVTRAKGKLEHTVGEYVTIKMQDYEKIIKILLRNGCAEPELPKKGNKGSGTSKDTLL